jgi:integrase
VEEQERLLAAAPTLKDLALFRIALTTGIRRADLANIRKGDVDLKNRKIKFWQDKKDTMHQVPISNALLPDLTRYLATVDKGTPWLFPNRDSLQRPMSDKTVYNRLQGALKLAGIEKEISVHDLRRSFVKTCLAGGMRPEIVAAITDDDVSTILEWYAIPDDHEILEATNKIGPEKNQPSNEEILKEMNRVLDEINKKYESLTSVTKGKQ